MIQEAAPGDTLAVFSTGAYNYSMSSNYNRIPKPPIVMVKAGSSRVIVKRETYDDLIKKRRVNAAGGFVFLLAFILYVTESTEKNARRRLLKKQLIFAPAVENHQKEPVEEISQAPFDSFQKEIFPLLNLR